MEEFRKRRSRSKDGLTYQCKACRQAYQRVIDPDAFDPEFTGFSKICYTCHKAKPLEDFGKHSRGLGGRSAACKECSRAQVNAYKHTMKSNDPLYDRRWNLKANYGLTLDDYDRMHASQGGQCAICHTDSPGGKGGKLGRFCVDHDHKTGVVRALLCHKCNTGLGMFKDDPEQLEVAIRYLLAFKEAAL